MKSFDAVGTGLRRSAKATHVCDGGILDVFVKGIFVKLCLLWECILNV